MTLQEIIKQHSFKDVPLLIEEFFPNQKIFNPVYLATFGRLDALISNGYPPFGSDLSIKISKGVGKDKDSEFILGSIVFDEYGSPLNYTTLAGYEIMAIWLQATIHYMTMEMHSDGEIFIRCIDGIALSIFSGEEAEAIVEEQRKIDEIIKKGKDNSSEK